MVVCTFLEAYDLKDKVIIPFFTYGATTYLNESMQKIYKVTSTSRHIPETLPEDLDAEDITTPGRLMMQISTCRATLMVQKDGYTESE